MQPLTDWTLTFQTIPKSSIWVFIIARPLIDFESEHCECSASRGVSEPSDMSRFYVSDDPRLHEWLIGFKEGFTRHPVDLDVFGLDEISPFNPLAHFFTEHRLDHLHVKIHRSGIRVDLNAGNLGSVLVEEDMGSDQLRLFCLDNFQKFPGKALIVIEPAFLDLPGADVD